MKFKDFLLNGLLSMISIIIVQLVLLLRGINLTSALNLVLIFLIWTMLNQLDQYVLN